MTRRVDRGLLLASQVVVVLASACGEGGTHAHDTGVADLGLDLAVVDSGSTDVGTDHDSGSSTDSEVQTDVGPSDAGADMGTDLGVTDAGVDAGMDAATDASVGHCASPTVVCTATYPCLESQSSYTCLGQYPDWLLGPGTFTVNGTGTVSDARTGLEWQQVFSSTLYTQAEAASYCAGLSLAGRGWRLPTRVELMTLVDRQRVNPSIDEAIFQGTYYAIPGFYLPVFQWTSSPHADGTGQGWLVNFNVGNSDFIGTSNRYSTRCVRSAEAGTPSAGGGGAPPGRFTFPDASTVYDTYTQLTWQQQVDVDTYDTVGAAAYCAALPLSGGGWRLPSIDELNSILDDTRSMPSIDGTAFPATPAAYFWSSTVYIGINFQQNWTVDFGVGRTSFINNTALFHVRCVK